MKLNDPVKYLDLFEGHHIFAAFPDREQGSAPPWHWHSKWNQSLHEKFMERQKCEIYSRVCGYMRPTHAWNLGKKEEFDDREVFKLPKDL